VEAEQINVYAQTSYKDTKKLGFILTFAFFILECYLDILVDIALIGGGFLTNVLFTSWMLMARVGGVWV